MKDLYESYIKPCCVALLLLLLATYAQAAKVAYTIDLTQQSQLDITSKGVSNGGETLFTYNGMKFYSAGGYFTNEALRIYGSKKLEISSYIGNITKIVITVSKSTYADRTLTVPSSYERNKDKSNLKYTITVKKDSASSTCFFSPDNVMWITKMVITIDQPTTYPLSISQYGYSSLYHGEYDLQLPSNSDLKAYTLAFKDGQFDATHTFGAGDIIPKGTPVLIKGAQGSYSLTISTDASAIDAENALKGLDVPGLIADSAGVTDYYHYYYKLTTLNQQNFGFYWGADDGGPFELKNPHRAYLRLPKSLFATQEEAKAFNLDDTLDAITSVTSDSKTTTEPLFDLQGRRVTHPAKGLYIRNGKKILIR